MLSQQLLTKVGNAVIGLRSFSTAHHHYRPVQRQVSDAVVGKCTFTTARQSLKPVQRELTGQVYVRRQHFNNPNRISPLDSMREFFMHPLTWDRNNGFLNLLLGLAIFGFCFCTSCAPERTKTTIEKPPKNA